MDKFRCEIKPQYVILIHVIMQIVGWEFIDRSSEVGVYISETSPYIAANNHITSNAWTFQAQLLNGL